MRKRGKSVPLEEMCAIFEREWTSAGFPDEYQEKEYRKAGREQLEAFYRTYIAAPADVLYQEKPFELPLDHEVVVTGRMDQVNRGGQGRSRDHRLQNGDACVTQKERPPISSLASTRSRRARCSISNPRGWSSTTL